MTTVTATTPAIERARSAIRIEPVTFVRVVASEWIKLRSLRSTSITLAAGVITMVAFGWLFSWARNNYWSTMRPDEIAMFNPIDTSVAGYSLAQIAVAVLGVLLVTGEYATGMIRSTFAAAPKRLPVLWAKASLYAVVTFVLMLAAAVVAFVGGQLFLGAHGVDIVTAEGARAVIGVAGYLAVIAVLAVAIGFIVRSTAAGVAILLGLLLVVPVAGLMLPSSWKDAVLPYLPSNVGTSLFANMTSSGGLSTAAAVCVLLAWPAVGLMTAAVLVRRRDA